MKNSRITNDAFSALFDDPVVSKNLRIRSELMILLEKEISARNLTQVAAAELLKVSQPRISDLLKGKIEKFSIDMLINMLSALNKEVNFSVT